MNVSKGDLALVVGAAGVAHGKTCEVVDYYGDLEQFKHCWVLKFPRPIQLDNGTAGLYALLPDAMLRRISGPPLGLLRVVEEKLCA